MMSSKGGKQDVRPVLMDWAALHSCLEIRLATANTEKLRPALKLIEQHLLAALDFGSQSTIPAHPFTILTGHQRHGKKLVHCLFAQLCSLH